MNTVLQKAIRHLKDFTALIYPSICMACAQNAPVKDEYLCFSCQINLPRTDFHLHLENTFTDRLWGRLDLQTATSMYLLLKGGLAENVVYNIKYKNATQLAIWLGQKYGRVLMKSPLYQNMEVIVPVPIHKSKMRTRGYNQSAMFGLGLAESMGVPCLDSGLLKLRKTKSQTKKSRMERLLSVQGEFAVNLPDRLQGKRVLLVDDVMTTGATIESCALELLKVEGVKVSMATIGIKNY